jgi:hypothetical protein
MLRMPEARVELARGCPRWILSPLRLPFRHSGPAGSSPPKMKFATAATDRSSMPSRREQPIEESHSPAIPAA